MENSWTPCNSRKHKIMYWKHQCYMKTSSRVIVYISYISYNLSLKVSALLQFSHFFRISNFFGLSLTEDTLLVKMRIWCIKICFVLVFHQNDGELTRDGILYILYFNTSRCLWAERPIFSPVSYFKKKTLCVCVYYVYGLYG
jgi:hypothetical protein